VFVLQDYTPIFSTHASKSNSGNVFCYWLGFMFEFVRNVSSLFRSAPPRNRSRVNNEYQVHCLCLHVVVVPPCAAAAAKRKSLCAFSVSSMFYVHCISGLAQRNTPIMLELVPLMHC